MKMYCHKVIASLCSEFSIACIVPLALYSEMSPFSLSLMEWGRWLCQWIIHIKVELKGLPLGSSDKTRYNRETVLASFYSLSLLFSLFTECICRLVKALGQKHICHVVGVWIKPYWAAQIFVYGSGKFNQELLDHITKIFMLQNNVAKKSLVFFFYYLCWYKIPTINISSMSNRW